MTSILDSTDLTRSKVRRRVFFLTSILGFAVLLTLRFVVVPRFAGTEVPSLGTVFEETLDSLIVAIAASIALGGLLYWLGTGQGMLAEMRVIEPREIAETLAEAREATSEWWYRGHTGRHLRAVTLPDLARRARSRNQSIAVSVQILDPSDDSACAFYARYRQGLRTAARDDEWTAERVRQELYATILFVYEMSGREPLLEFVVAVQRTISVYRVDLSSRLAVITKEDPKEPALRCDSGTFFHASYREDLKMARQQGNELDHRVGIDSFAGLSVSDVRSLFDKLDLSSPSLEDNVFVEKVIELARDARNPYA